jgi:hypothetical protein
MKNKAQLAAVLAFTVGVGICPGVACSQNDAAGPVQVQNSPSKPPQGELVVLDHVVAVINGDVILESDVREEMRFAALQPDRADPKLNTPQSALRRLIDRHLILQQMKVTQLAPRTPKPEEVQKQLRELRKQIPECAAYRCETEAGWQAFLKVHNLTLAEVEAHWRERMIILSFIQSRFGAGVRISDAETKEYYDKNFAPEFAKRHLKPPQFETVAGRIQEILLQQKVNSILQEWLQSLKDEGNVTILSSSYREIGDAPTSGENTKPQAAASPKEEQ